MSDTTSHKPVRLRNTKPIPSMKATKLLLVSVLVLVAAALPVTAAPDHPADKSGAPAAPDAAWLAKAKADYPLKTCIVSEEELGGGMGDAVDFVYKQEGQSDRLVRFCCEMCLPKFKKDPAKYLKVIDEAAAKAKKS